MRRRTFWLLAGVPLLAFTAAVAFNFFTAPPHPRINPDQFHRIREGMTLAEVNGIIGGPPGIYDPDVLCTRRGRVIAGPDDLGSDLSQQAYWCGREYDIGVLLDDGVVVSKRLVESEIPPQPTWLERIRDTLGW
jgi:hypothetical protein